LEKKKKKKKRGTKQIILQNKKIVPVQLFKTFPRSAGRKFQIVFQIEKSTKLLLNNGKNRIVNRCQ